MINLREWKAAMMRREQRQQEQKQRYAQIESSGYAQMNQQRSPTHRAQQPQSPRKHRPPDVILAQQQRRQPQTAEAQAERVKRARRDSFAKKPANWHHGLRAKTPPGSSTWRM